MNMFAQTIVTVNFPTFDNARKVAQKELESEYVCPNNCYSQFTEDEMYSIRLQMAELGEPKHRMHKCQHPASNVCQSFELLFLKVLFCT